MWLINITRIGAAVVSLPKWITTFYSKRSTKSCGRCQWNCSRENSFKCEDKNTENIRPTPTIYNDAIQEIASIYNNDSLIVFYSQLFRV